MDYALPIAHCTRLPPACLALPAGPGGNARAHRRCCQERLAERLRAHRCDEPFRLGARARVGAVGLYTWLSGLAKSREARKEVRRLREHLNTQMDITQRGNTAMKAELDTLKTQNENLRVQVREWQTKPGPGEMRQLAVYDRAIRILNQNAPGFSPVWERAVKESEEEIAATDTGVSSVLRRAFRPFAALGNGSKTEKPAGGSTFEEHHGIRRRRS